MAAARRRSAPPATRRHDRRRDARKQRACHRAADHGEQPPGATGPCRPRSVYRKATSTPSTRSWRNPTPHRHCPGRPPQPQTITEIGPASRIRVYKQRQSGILIADDHDVIAAVVRGRSATSEPVQAVHDTSNGYPVMRCRAVHGRLLTRHVTVTRIPAGCRW
jgi:hypothetical protein